MSSPKFVISNASDGGTGSTEGDFPDHLKCPICIEIPMGSIYQCKNGHIICDKCKHQPEVRDCPQCRVPFEVDGGDVIRNRALENFLKSIVVPCPFRHNGCQRDLPLNGVESHSEKCDHNDKRIQLCKLLGYNCDYWTNPLNGSSTVGHFHSHHKAYISHCDFIYLKFDNFMEAVKDMKTFNGVWKPVILYNDKTTVMILTVLKPKQNFVTWIALNLTPEVFIPSNVGFGSGFGAGFNVKNKDFGYPKMSWEIPVVSVLKFKEVFRNPYFRLRITTLQSRCLDVSEILNVCISLKRDVRTSKDNYVYLRKITPMNYFVPGGDRQKEEEIEMDEHHDLFLY